MKIFMSKKIQFWSVLYICFGMVMLMTMGCTKEQYKDDQIKEEQSPVIQEEIKLEGKTWFAPYSQSINLKDDYFNYLFFCDKTDRERWDNRLNIQSIYLKVADCQQRMIINAIQVEDEVVYGNYYRGILTLEGKLKDVSSGEMSLLVKMADSEAIREFHLGKCSVVKGSGTGEKGIIYAQSSAVAKPDKSGDIVTYGNIVYINTKKDIKIQNIDIALEEVGLDTKHYKIYFPREYKAIAGRIAVEPCDEYMVFSLEENNTEGTVTAYLIEHPKGLGYVPVDIDYCILTHLDIDHAGALRLVKDAKKIMASEAEVEAAGKLHVRYRKCLWEDVKIRTFPNEEYDLFQDGSIVLLPLPGHSAGMTGVKIQNGEKYVILAGDAGYCRQSWEQLTLPGITWDNRKRLSLCSFCRWQQRIRTALRFLPPMTEKSCQIPSCYRKKERRNIMRGTCKCGIQVDQFVVLNCNAGIYLYSI